MLFMFHMIMRSLNDDTVAFMGQFYGRSHHGMVLRCDAALVDHFLCHGAQALNLLLPMGGQWVAHWPTGIHWLDLI
jgi:hypothetical protein